MCWCTLSFYKLSPNPLDILQGSRHIVHLDNSKEGAVVVLDLSVAESARLTLQWTGSTLSCNYCIYIVLHCMYKCIVHLQVLLEEHSDIAINLHGKFVCERSTRWEILCSHSVPQFRREHIYKILGSLIWQGLISVKRHGCVLSTSYIHALARI